MADFDFTTDSFEEEEPQAEIGTGFGGANVAPAEKLSDTDQFLRDSGIAEENRAELAGDDPELDPADKELVLNNPAHFMEEGEDRDQADAEWKGVEDKVQGGRLGQGCSRTPDSRRRVRRYDPCWHAS